MTNQMTADAIVIRQQVLKTEHATNAAAEEQSRLLATLLNKRGNLECPLSLGEAEIARAHQAIGRVLGSMRSLAMMHKGLHTVADDGDGSEFGPHKTVPNTPGGHLRVA